MPAIYHRREFAAAGGLMSYGPSLRTRIARPASIPAASSRARSRPTCRSMQSTKFELVINLKTAKALGLEVPADAARPRRRGDRVSNCHLVAGEIADRFGRVKAGASRPRATRGYGLDPAKSISAAATVRSARCADRYDGRPKRHHREPLR